MSEPTAFCKNLSCLVHIADIVVYNVEKGEADFQVQAAYPRLLARNIGQTLCATETQKIAAKIE